MDSSEQHLMSYKTLGLVLAVLLLLTGVTVGVSYLDLGSAQCTADARDRQRQGFIGTALFHAPQI